MKKSVWKSAKIVSGDYKKCVPPTVADSLWTNKRGGWNFYQKIQMLLNKQGG